MSETLSFFTDVTSHFYGATPSNADEIARQARMALWATKQPQAVHYHAEDTPCVRGGSCYVLQVPEVAL